MQDSTPHDLFARLQHAERECATSRHNDKREPTPAMAECGNYAHGRIAMHGLQLKLENPRGSVRSGVSEDGKAWSNRMAATYGEIVGTRGADGDAVDVFIGPFPESQAVWVINQGWPDGGFDEHKVMLGCGSEQMARDLYLGSFDRGWNGLQSIAPATLGQLKWWLRHGDMSKPFSINALPFLDGTDTMSMEKTLWTPQAELIGKTMAALLYGLRVDDQTGLMLDSVSLGDLLADPDIEALPQPVLDALVVPVARMSQRMDLLQRVMNAAGTALNVTDYTISDPIRARGVMQVAVLFALSDGQAVTVWFHNPDTTPAKITPLDDLVSWKWMLNKKDITIVVAPERGRELNPREVARRVMKLAERNSAKFAEANSKLAAKVQAIADLDAEIAGLETRLGEVQSQIAVARQKGEDAAADLARIASLPATDPRRYAQIRDDEEALLAHQDELDHFFGGRIMEVRNALRELGWDGEKWGQLSRNGALLDYDLKHVGAGRNVVAATWKVEGNAVPGFTIADDLTKTPAEIAAELNGAVLDVEPETVEPMTPAYYASIFGDDAALAARVADIDPLLTKRYSAVVDALLDMGWTNNGAGSARKGEISLSPSKRMAGDSDSIVSLTYGFSIPGNFPNSSFQLRDMLDDAPSEMAAKINAAADELLASAAGALPAGWSESRPGGMATNADPLTGGIVDINDDGWFVIMNSPDVPNVEKLATRDAAFEYVARQLAKQTPPRDASRSGAADEQAAADAALAMAAGVVAELGGTFTADGFSGEGTAGAWSYGNASVNGKDLRLAASGGGVVQVNGRPFDPAGTVITTPEQVRAAILAIAPAVTDKPQEFERAGRRIYPTRIKSGDEVKMQWAVETDENKARRAAGERALGGDRLADTQDEAKAIAEEMNAHAEREAKSAAEFAEQQAAQAAAQSAREAARLEGLEGFVDSMTPMGRARALDTLNKEVRSNGKFTSVKQMVRDRLDQGYTVRDDRTYGRIIAHPDGRFIEQKRLTKIGMDFAAYLQAKRGATAAADEQSPVERVDAAYSFGKASDAFKEAIAHSIAEEHYSPFKSAVTIDKAAAAEGMTVDWDVVGAPVLDDIGPARANLLIALDVVETNLPINEAEGNLDQADLERDTAASIREALAVLDEHEAAQASEPASVLDAADDEGDKPKEGNEPAKKDDEKAEGASEDDDDGEDDTDPEKEWDATPESDKKDEILDGDFPGHPFRGNQYRKAGKSSSAAVETSMRAKYQERKGDAKSQASAHKAAHHAHKAASIGAKGKAKKYHEKMAKFHGSRAGDSVLDAAAILDAVPKGDAEGVILKGGVVVGRVGLALGDGKAMVFIGPEGDARAIEGMTMTDDSDEQAYLVQALARKFNETMARVNDPDAEIVDSVVASLKAGEQPITRTVPGLDKFSVAYAGDEMMLDDGLRAKIEAAMGEKLVEKTIEGRGITLIALVPASAAPAAATEGETVTPEIDWTKAEEVNNSLTDLANFGEVRINDVGSENVYFEKDGKPYFTKLLNTDDYTAGQTADFTDLRPGSDGLPADDQAPTGGVEPAAADRAYLDSLIDGTGDLLAADTFDRLEPMFAKYEADAEMMALLERAAQAYGDAAQAAAQKALSVA